MSKNKEKDHLLEEAKKTGKIVEQVSVAPAHHEARTEAEAKTARQAGGKAEQTAEPTDAHPGFADLPSQSAMAEHGEKKLQKALHEIEHLKDQLLRMRADYDNFRKRSLREKGEIYENANESLMLDLLPVLDHFQLAVKSALRFRSLFENRGSGQALRPASGQANPAGSANSTDSASSGQAFQEGIQMIFDQLMDTLSKYGLVPFNAEKQIFDPKLHEAISSLPSATEPEGAIIAQSRQGYLFKDKLLRPAQVVVSGGAPKDSVKAEKTAKSEPTDTDVQPDEE